MEQRFSTPEPDTIVTDEEVRALVQRFGERQAMAQGQPTVRDVAEAMQVEPATVQKMLEELRRSKDQDEIKARLDRLERENAELRARTTFEPVYDEDYRAARRPRAAILAAAMAGVMAMLMMTKMSHGSIGAPFAVLAFLPLILIFAITRLRNGCNWK